MKTIIKISVLLNVGLLGTVIFLGENSRTLPVSAPAIPAVAATIEPETAPAPVMQTVVAPFQWSQLMSTNGYRSFVANLRTAGCPESTVEDIVRGNVQRAFDWKRGELHVDGSEPGPWSAQAQVQMVAYFLGQTPDVQKTVEIAEGSSEAASPERPVIAALVSLQDIEPTALAALNLSNEQKQMISEVQRTYSTALNGQKQQATEASQSSPEQAGDATQNPQNPLSVASPQQTQTGVNAGQEAQQNQAQLEASANTALEGALGSDAYLGYTLAQEQTALENQLKAHPDWVSGNPQQ